MLKKSLIVLGASLITAILFTGCSSGSNDEAKTIKSLTKISDDLYMIDCYTDYKVDEYLDANITNVKDWDKWMTENITKGVPTGDIPQFGCASFSTIDASGNHYFARNFERFQGDSIIVRTAPENGYASIGVADLVNINLGSRGDYKIDDKSGKSLLLAAPWGICDGINEKGLGVSILELMINHEVTDTEKGDFLVYSATRVLLDKCATVDEAIDLLNNYDVYSPKTNSYHIFITDISGRSAVAEWVDGEFQVVESNAATNFNLFGGDPYNCYRYIRINEQLESTKTMSSDECMELLKDVSQHGICHWSAVYNLDKFSIDVCFNEDFDNVYSYLGKIEE